MTIRVVIADDHRVVRDGLCYLLGQEPDVEVAGEAGDGRQTVAVVAATLGVPGDDMDTGLALVEKAIGLNRNNADAFRVGGLLYAYKGEIDRAVEHQQQAALPLRRNQSDSRESICTRYIRRKRSCSPTTT